jgi:hypothetical protein
MVALVFRVCRLYWRTAGFGIRKVLATAVPIGTFTANMPVRA